MTKLVYIMDPLCGWCYGATPTLNTIKSSTEITLEVMPSGLFSGHGARSMSDEFAQYAWQNDQRIHSLTGQPFTEDYRKNVLNDHSQYFDSGPATLALTAVFITAPGAELDALKAIQNARYAKGLDVTNHTVLSELLAQHGFNQASARLQQHDDQLQAINQSRIQQAQQLMHQFSLNGVPSLLLETDGTTQPIQSQTLYSDPAGFMNLLQHSVTAKTLK